MSEKDAPDLNAQQIKAALTEELDGVAPRRDLWPSIQEGVRRPQPKLQRRWLLPAFGSAAILGAAVVAILLFASPLLSPEGTPSGPALSAPAQPLPRDPFPANLVPSAPALALPPPEAAAAAAGRGVGLLDGGGRGPFGFEPAEFNFSVRETVTFTFVGESTFHTFTVADLGIDVGVAGGATVSFKYTFDTPGTYELICIPHEALGMVGTITVH